MKRWICLALAAVLLLLCCACGASDTKSETKQETKTVTLEEAKKLIGSELKAVYAALGKPESTAYASSCLGAGEDGELHYRDFTVYTYRDTNGKETVYDVMERTAP